MKKCEFLAILRDFEINRANTIFLDNKEYYEWYDTNIYFDGGNAEILNKYNNKTFKIKELKLFRRYIEESRMYYLKQESINNKSYIK